MSNDWIFRPMEYGATAHCEVRCHWCGGYIPEGEELCYHTYVVARQFRWDWYHIDCAQAYEDWIVLNEDSPNYEPWTFKRGSLDKA